MSKREFFGQDNAHEIEIVLGMGIRFSQITANKLG